MTPAALLFDFDGVLLESEYDSNVRIAAWLTALGHPTTLADTNAHFTGLAGQDFLTALERWIGGPLPPDFHDFRKAENLRALTEGIEPVTGAIAFVRALPPTLPRAITSSSTTHWITTQLDHLGLRDAFPLIFSGSEHVTRGKPAPDLYLHAAAALGVDITRCTILEDSPIGVTGALASGARVIGLCAARHCDTNHAARLRALGVREIACDFGEVRWMIFD